MNIRPARLEDADEIMFIFKDAVHSICVCDYSESQISAWISSASDKLKWEKKIENQVFLVSENDDSIAGFGSIENGEYIDLLYVRKDFQGKGIAHMLLSELEKYSVPDKSCLYSDVSKTAVRFFEKHGYTVIAEQEKFINGISITNYRMVKEKQKSS